MADLLQLAGITLDATASSREEAVAICGSLLVSLGAVSQDYADAMWEREQIFPSELGDGFAIPHGTDESRSFVNFDQLVFVRFQQPVTWVNEQISVCVGIASQGDGHVEILGNLADLLMDDDAANILRTSSNPEEIRDLIVKGA
ncbi:MAG: PTS sugar transporter subunit IIA [Microbacteriaceae bacterium]|jgi:mannitol PTS system EIIA component|nr:PTS sugar transporter subunit IIA [Microbacteriaceae bacterium]